MIDVAGIENQKLLIIDFYRNCTNTGELPLDQLVNAVGFVRFPGAALPRQHNGARHVHDIYRTLFH